MLNYSIEMFATLLKTTSYSDGRTRTMKPGSDGFISVNITALNATEQCLARGALKEIGTITGLKFSETAGSADITYLNGGTSANCRTTASGDTINRATITIGSSRVEAGDGPGSFAFRTYMHETCHALGLGHPQDYGDITDFALSNIANDSWQMSLMSYFDQNENTTVNATKAYHLTPMMADYTALRQMYGDASIRAGDTVYGVGSNAGGSLDAVARLGANGAFMIADTSGTDRVNFSHATADQRIDLTPGAISDVMGAIGNMQIAADTLIEHASGGGGTDKIIGNAIANGLAGGGGNDRLWGRSGNDTLDGGLGADTLEGGTGDDVYITDGSDTVVEIAGGGTDTLQVRTTTSLQANLENLVLLGNAAIDGSGNFLANQIIGNAGDNQLDGGLGNDTLKGGGGTDTATYFGNTAVSVNLSAGRAQSLGHGRDILAGIENVKSGSAADRLIGNAGSNTLESGAGNDLLHGNGGVDRLIGGAGDDSYYTDGRDLIVESAGHGNDTVFSTVSHALGANIERLTLLGTAGGLQAIGNGLNNVITGNAKANILVGHGGNDVLNGNGGADRLSGGQGNDRYYIDGDDIIQEIANQGIDTIMTRVSGSLANNVERLVLMNDARAIAGTGNNQANVIVGNALGNTLSGRGGNDVLNGNDGADRLIGGSGKDIMDGGRADGDADVFVFGSQTDSPRGINRDTVVNFERGIDKIDLSGIDANATLSGNQRFGFASDGAAYSVWTDRISSGVLLRADLDGDGHADLDIRLVGVADLSASDILL